ncbi:MAG TPA: RagB/SusD family nutrient uptake outer membrane protein [Puia sp.]|nr:RagB/SusD family nutrient uptake outer membrane protein [Puia sp.]
MKKRFNIIVVATTLFLALFTFRCKKFTQVSPHSQFSPSQVFSDVNNAYTAVIGVYDLLMGDGTYGDIMSQYFPYDCDEMITTGNIDNGRRGMARYQLLLSNTVLRSPFVNLYSGVENANLCIEQIPQMDMYKNGTADQKAQLQRLYGEALTLRAQFFFELIRNWGDVPAPFVPSYKEKNLFLPRADRDSTYDHIIADLKTAEDLVPWRTDVVADSRITKGAVKALRARIALFRGGYSLRNDTKTMERRSDYLTYYQIARDECADLMARRDEHTLNPVFGDIWHKYLCGFQYDPYGEILFQAGAGGGNNNSDSKMGNYGATVTATNSRYGSGIGGIAVNPQYYYAFDSLDSRRDITCAWYSVNADNTRNFRTLTSMCPAKFGRDFRNPLLPGSVQDVGYNWPLIRFSDVLLMFAEADNEINNGPNAQDIAAFEEVRKRGFKGHEDKIGVTPTDYAGFFNAIVDERFLEFGGEGIRKYDLIRWNLLGTKIQEARDQIQQMSTGAGAYANVPRFIFWKQSGESILFYGGANGGTVPPLYTPSVTTTPAGYTKAYWRDQLTISSSHIDGLPLWQAIAEDFVPGKSELFPFDQATMDSYGGKLTQNPNY